MDMNRVLTGSTFRIGLADFESHYRRLNHLY